MGVLAALLPAPAVRVVIDFRDAEGKRFVTTHWLPYSQTLGLNIAAGNADSLLLAAANALQAAIGGASNAQVQSVTVSESYGWNKGVGATGTDYENAEEKALLEFQNIATGDVVHTMLGSPAISVFLPGDRETVDPANALVTAIEGALNGGVGHTSVPYSSRDGIPAIAKGTGGSWAFTKGYLLRKRTRRKFEPGWATEVGGD